jgi:hypothetical protein
MKRNDLSDVSSQKVGDWMVSNNARPRWRLVFAGIAFKGDLGKRSRGNCLPKNNTCRHLD